MLELDADDGRAAAPGDGLQAVDVRSRTAGNCEAASATCWRWLSGPGRPAGGTRLAGRPGPGSVLDDLHEARQVPDPYRGTNTLAQRMGAATHLALPARARPSGASAVRASAPCSDFDGVDHECDGPRSTDAEGAAHQGMFLAFTWT